MATRPSPDSWAVISKLLDEALDVVPADRPAWIASLGRRDAAAANAVQAWLDEFAVMEAGGFLANRAPQALPASAALVGLEVGAYRLVEPIGYGGMGTVWLAERRDGQFDQRVAVKLLNAAFMDAAGTERFAREAAILARLTHPSISRIIDAGVSALGAPYLALEYVAGVHVDTYCDTRRLSITDRLYLFLDVLAPVAHAHANLVVHRDLKPGNVLVTDDGHVKLLDFGIAKLLGHAAEHPTVIASQATALTPAYAAPEQLTGGDVTTATDVYALGVLLYQLLTGRHPSLGASVTPAALVEAVLHAEPTRASDAAVASTPGGPSSDVLAANRDTTPERLRARLAGDLDTILGKALKKSPTERYTSVAAFEDDLRRCLRHQPIAARPDTIRYRVRKFTRRHRAPVALAAIAGVALVAGLVGTISQARRATAQAARADREAADAREQRDFARRQLARAEAINDLNAFLIADAAPMGEAFTARELLERAERIVSQQGDDSNGTRVDSLIAIGGMLGAIGDTTRAVTLLEQAYEASRLQPDPALRARAACELGDDVVKTGDIERARRLIGEGLAAVPDAQLHGLTRAECLGAAADVEMWAGEGERAVAHVAAARATAQAAGIGSPLLELRLSMQRAEALRVADHDAEASAAFAEAYRRLVALGRENTERAGTLLNNWGLLLGALGRPLEAERMLRQSIAVSVARGSDARVEPISWANLARALSELGRHAEATPLAERAMREARARGDAVVADQAQLLLARLYVQTGRVAHGEALLDDVERRFRQRFPGHHAAHVAVAFDRVRIALARHDVEAAGDLAERAHALVAGHASLRGSLPGALRFRALVNVRRDRFAEGREDAERLLALLADAASPSETSSTIGAGQLVLGEALAGLGRTAEARAALAEAQRHLEGAAGKDHPNAKRARELLAGL